MFIVGQTFNADPWEVGTIRVIGVDDFGDSVIVTTVVHETGASFHTSANLPKSCQSCMSFPMDLRAYDGHKH